MDMTMPLMLDWVLGGNRLGPFFSLLYSSYIDLQKFFRSE